MKGLGFAAVIAALIPLHALAQDYTTATNSAWCAGALEIFYARSTERGATYLDRIRSRQLDVAQNFFSPTGGAEILMLRESWQRDRGGV